MPQSSQIIPDHLYPYEKVVVNDNTTYQPAVPEQSDDSVKMLFVFASPKGEDGVIKTIDKGLNQFINTFGQGPFSLYGQPYLNAYAAFSTGNIVGHCLRVTAENASYSYSNLVALYKVDETGKMTVRFKTRTAETELTDIELLDSLYTSPVGVITGENNPDAGFTEVKLFSVAALGRGAYGKKLLYSVSSNAGGDKENAYKNYIFNVYENFTSLLQKESYAVCFTEDAIVDNESLFIEGVVNDPDNGSERIKVVTYLDGFKQLYDAYKDANPDTILTVEDFDPILGVNKYSKNAISNYEIDTTSEDVVVLNSLNGIALEGGSDGDFSESADPEVRAAALNARYLAAFSGEIDPLIKSKNRFPTTLILDADFSPETKQALLALVESRGDCMDVIDCGTSIKTKNSPVNYVKNNLSAYASHRNHMIDAICGKIRDPYSKKIVTVTSTFLLASQYPNHWNAYGGKHVPLAGNTYGVIDGFIKNSVYPVYDEDIDSDLMDELCEEKINFARINAKQEVIRATQTTRQTMSSNLSEANNVFVLLDIKRDCEKLCATYHYNFSEASDIGRFNKDAEMLLTKYAGSQVRSITAKFDKNDWEAVRGILHLYVEMVHKDLVKQTIIEIDVNRSSSSNN